MKQYLAFIRKEIFHVLRDRKTLLVLFGIPIVQILLFGFALSTEVKNSHLAVMDMSKDDRSRSLIEQIDASKYFDVREYAHNNDEIESLIRKGKAKAALILPENMANDLATANETQIQLVVDGSDPNLATTIVNYCTAILQDFQKNELAQPDMPYSIEIQTRMLYNPLLRGEFTFVPGVMSLVLMLICSLMTSVSIVKEKELGNMEILLVSPLRPLTIILSKTIPYLILSLIILSVILALSVFLLNVPIQGSILLLYAISLLFILASLSLGMCISSITDSQQVAMMISLIGLMLPTIMLSGFMFPIENMPVILQTVSNVVPAKWFYYGISDVMIKGLGISYVAREMYILTGFTLLFLGLSYANFKTRLA